MDTEAPIKDDLVERLEGIRMLAPETLRMLQQFASRAEGVALEVGPYIGASTIAIASGRPDLQLLTIERGGSRLDHEVRSADILTDLRKNLTIFGVADRVTVIEGWSYDPDVVAEVSRRLAGRKIGFLFFDANGEIPMLIADYGHHLSADSLIAFDDYRCGLEKSLRVDATVALLIRTRAVREICVEGGTWFGEVAGPEGLAALRRAGNRFIKNGNHCVAVALTGPWRPDSKGQKNASRLRLFEDGRELGPAHTLHADIRAFGGGRFSHYSHEAETAPDGSIDAEIFFSASDDSDPGTNGRRYTALIDGFVLDLSDGALQKAPPDDTHMSQMFSVQASAGETLTREMYDSFRDEIRPVQKLTNAHAEAAQKAITYGGSTSTEDCFLLYLLIRRFNRKHVFEIGTYIGTSAVCMNEAVRKNGGVLSTSDPVNYGALPPYSGIRFMHGRSSNALQILHQEQRQIDFCFMDWVPDSETLEFAERVFAPDTVIAVHDYGSGDGKGAEIVSVLNDTYCKARPGTWFYPTGAPWHMDDGMPINQCTAFFVPRLLL